MFLDDNEFANKGPVSYVASGCGGTLAIFLALWILTMVYLVITSDDKIKLLISH